MVHFIVGPTVTISDNHPAMYMYLTLLHSEWPELHRVLAILSAIGLKVIIGKLIFGISVSVYT